MTLQLTETISPLKAVKGAGRVDVETFVDGDGKPGTMSLRRWLKS
jgi:hypothetical protein